ncbi:unnamed protein product, partial [Rotaria socialis]
NLTSISDSIGAEADLVVATCESSFDCLDNIIISVVDSNTEITV